MMSTQAALIEAVEAGDSKKVQTLLATDGEKVDLQGNVMALIEPGTTVTIPVSMLMFAVSQGHKDIAEQLIAAGADVDHMITVPLSKDMDPVAQWHSALTFALGLNDNNEMLQLLLQHASSPLAKTHALYYAAASTCSGQEAEVSLQLELILKAGASLEATEEQEGKLRRTALGTAIATEYDNIALALWLSAKEANERGTTPILHAAALGYSVLIPHLLRNGESATDADPNTGDTPLHKLANLPLEIYDAELGAPLKNAVKSLITHGADPKTMNRQGDTPISLAVSKHILTKQLQSYVKLSAVDVNDQPQVVDLVTPALLKSETLVRVTPCSVFKPHRDNSSVLQTVYQSPAATC